MAAAAIGAGAGAVLGTVSSVMGLRSENKGLIKQIESQGRMLGINMRMINQSHIQLDRELGDILSENALETAKNMATAKVMMSASGTVGGTTAQVSKQAYMDQIRADADAIAEAKNQSVALLNEQLSARINFRNQASQIRSQMKTPMEAILGTLTAGIGMASQGAMMGQSVAGAMPTSGGVDLAGERNIARQQNFQWK